VCDQFTVTTLLVLFSTMCSSDTSSLEWGMQRASGVVLMSKFRPNQPFNGQQKVLSNKCTMFLSLTNGCYKWVFFKHERKYHLSDLQCKGADRMLFPGSLHTVIFSVLKRRNSFSLSCPLWSDNSDEHSCMSNTSPMSQPATPHKLLSRWERISLESCNVSATNEKWQIM